MSEENSSGWKVAAGSLAAVVVAFSPFAACAARVATDDISSISVVTSEPGAVQAKPGKITDGDTFHVTMPDGTDDVIRIVGIDTPETTKGKHDCYGQEATDYVADALAGAGVVLVPDPTQNDRDRYERAIRYVTLPDGSDLGLALIRDGLAREYTYSHAYQRQAEYRTAEAAARVEQRGGWAPTNRGGCGWR